MIQIQRSLRRLVGGPGHARRCPTPRCPVVAAASNVQSHGFASEPSDTSRKAAALMIGNEILNGQIADTNLPWLAKMLYNRGIDMVRAEFVPDDTEEIAKTLQSLRSRVGENGMVFTSGGIGPTHDDVTYEAVALAFGCDVEEHAGTIERMTRHYESQGKELTKARRKMACLPKGADILLTEGLWVPLAVMGGEGGGDEAAKEAAGGAEVYILPGIPSLFQRMLMAQEPRFRGPAIYSTTIFTNSGEGDLAEALNEIVAKYPKCDFGSYPKTRADEDYLTKLVLHSRDKTIIEQASKDILSHIPKCWQKEEA